MKHVALSLLAAACGALSASALDASNARIWLDEKIQPDFATIGSGISNEKLGSTPAYARSWQYLSIPVHVEGAAKGDSQPHFIPELKVRITLAVTTTDAKGKDTDSPELLSKEITYVDVPLSKHARKNNMGEGVVNVGVFISPSNAFKLNEKDGALSKKLIAVAVEGTFMGSSCNRIKEKANDGVATGVVVDSKAGKHLAEGWWKKKGSSSAVLAAISETPFAHEYARLGFPPVSPMYGGAGASSAPSSPATADASLAGASSASPASPSSSGGPVSGPAVDDSATSADADAADDDATTGKKSKKNKKSRR